jgi:hypothetical protein
MITYEFSFICDSRKVIGCPVMECESIIGSESWALASNVKQAWLEIRKQGWREAKWRGKTRHLCPECWRQYLEERR